MLEIKDIVKTYSDRKIFDRISFTLESGITALVGENGTGKTTLFEILAGNIEPDSGCIRCDESMGYLPQKFYFKTATVMDFLKSSAIQPKKYHEFLWRVTEMGIELDAHQPAKSLSGGEKTKLYLASLMLRTPQPTLMLLDEPTNNLDVEGIAWLKDFLATFKGSVLLTSHDRRFLDETADRIMELNHGKLTFFGGSYSKYQEQKKIIRQAYERRYYTQEEKIAKIKEDIASIKTKAKEGEKVFSSRQPYQRRKIRKSAQRAVSRQSKLEKFLNSQKHLEKLQNAIHYPFKFVGSTHSDKYMLGLDRVSKTYGTKRVLNTVSFSVIGNEHVWLSGANGSGKSTILRLFTGKETADLGSIVKGDNVRFGYFSQEALKTDDDTTGLAELMAMGTSKEEAYRYAGFLHVEPEDLIKPFAMLSRGQVTKIEFIKLLMVGNDILLLDEPTNHLDVKTREEIEVALKEYKGAMLIASHDRYFLDTIGINRRIQIERGVLKET